MAESARPHLATISTLQANLSCAIWLDAIRALRLQSALPAQPQLILSWIMVLKPVSVMHLCYLSYLHQLLYVFARQATISIQAIFAILSRYVQPTTAVA
jgi:hypothetical protein